MQIPEPLSWLSSCSLERRQGIKIQPLTHKVLPKCSSVPKRKLILILFHFKFTRSPLHFGVAGTRKGAMKPQPSSFQKVTKPSEKEKAEAAGGGSEGRWRESPEFLLLLNTPTLTAARPPPPPRGLGSANEKAKPGLRYRNNDFPVAFLHACCFIIAEVDIYFQ